MKKKDKMEFFNFRNKKFFLQCLWIFKKRQILFFFTINKELQKLYKDEK